MRSDASSDWETLGDRFKEKVRVGVGNECWIWLGAIRSKNVRPDHPGYGTMMVCGRQESAHRVSYLLHKGPIPPGLEIDHTCSNSLCVNPNHLILSTKSENSKATYARGRRQAANKRLTDADVTAAREERRAGASLPELAEKYGVNRMTIKKAVIGETFAHLPGELDRAENKALRTSRWRKRK
jgi:hypothetical protein